jgi:ABC-type transport system substrate-binding protein
MPQGNFNLEREVFRDIRVRKAFAHAIDRKVLAGNGFFGFAKPATGPVTSYQTNFYTPDTERYPYSVEKAEELLEAAGLKKDAQGVRLRVDNLLPGGLEDFVDLVVPELQRRGLFRTAYEGTTLRDHLGLSRPPLGTVRAAPREVDVFDVSLHGAAR